MGIDAKDLILDLDLLACSGIVLSPEQRASLQTAFVILKEQYKFKTIHLWGKILGTIDDYYIVQGRQADEMKDRQYLYSKDCMNWNMLSQPSEDAKELTPLCHERFTGDPSHDFEITKYNTVHQGTEEETIEEYKTALREEDRLSAALLQIEHDASIVPRGAYILQPNGEIQRSRTFEGLTPVESGKLTNYFHFREPTQSRKKAPQQQALDKSIKFFDCIDDDIPKGWSVQFERGSGLLQIRSLKWLGMAFFHIPETNRYGSLYYGTGLENKDLPFML